MTPRPASSSSPSDTVSPEEHPADEVILRATGVTKSYPEVTALHDVDLEVRDRSFTALLGPSGCGKSTLLQILAGLLPPSHGSVSYHGRNIVGPEFDIIYLFQQYTRSLFPWHSVLGNVAFGLRARKRLPKSDVISRCRRYLELVGLTGRDKSYPWQLSGGMQQRVAIARALVCEPRVLLMDEPFGSVDALTRAELQDLLLRLWEHLRLTVVFVTHDVEEAIYLSQKVAVFSVSPGRIVYDTPIGIAYPRHQVETREDPEYVRHRRELLAVIQRTLS